MLIIDIEQSSHSKKETTMKSQSLKSRISPRFSGIKTFFRLPIANISDDYDIALFGMPYDGAVSFRPGARFGPSRIREVSSLGRDFHWPLGISWTKQLKTVDIGDCHTIPLDQEQTYKHVEDFISILLSHEKGMIGVGGDHSLTLPILRAMKQKLGPVRLLHFDAHLDTYPAAWGCEYHHGAFLRHAIEEKLILPDKSFQFGIRGPLTDQTDLDFVIECKINVNTVDHIRKEGIAAFINKIPSFEDNIPTYISFDIDCLDPSYAPGTGTPVVGGLTTYEIQQILRHLKIKNLVGADVMEVSPPYDCSEITCLAAMDVMFEMLCLYARSKMYGIMNLE